MSHHAEIQGQTCLLVPMLAVCPPPGLQLEEGESRLDLILHYGIAYPRLHNIPTGAVVTAKGQASSIMLL